MKILGLLFITIVANLAFANKELRIATEGYYPPFSEIGADGRLSGFDIDIMNALCSEMKTKCQIVHQEWDSLIPSLTSKKFDAVIASMTITPEREKIVAFTTPYFKSDLMTFISPSAKKKYTLDEVKKGNFKIGVLKASSQEEFLTKQKLKTIVAYDSTDLAIMDLNAGRIDLLFTEDFIAKFYMEKNKDKFKKLKDDSLLIKTQGMGIAVRKDDKVLLENLNKALESIKENGKYEEIKARYFGE